MGCWVEREERIRLWFGLVRLTILDYEVGDVRGRGAVGLTESDGGEVGCLV